MPLTLPNTTLNLSTVDQLKAVYEYVVAELGLAEAPNPFTNGLLRQSDQDIAKLIHEVISANLVSVGCSVLPSFSIPDYDNDTLVKVLIDQLNYSIAASNLGGDGGESTSLLLGSTGAIETADGEYQRFVWDGETLNLDNQGVWEANLPAEDRGAAYRIKMKMPVMVADDPFAIVKIGAAPSYMATIDGSDGNQVVLEVLYVANNLATELCLYAQSILGGDYTFTDSLIIPAPVAGTVITLEVTQSTAVMSWGNESYPLVITSGALPSPSDVLAYSAGFEPPLPLSIKVSVTS